MFLQKGLLTLNQRMFILYINILVHEHNPKKEEYINHEHSILRMRKKESAHISLPAVGLAILAILAIAAITLLATNSISSQNYEVSETMLGEASQARSTLLTQDFSRIEQEIVAQDISHCWAQALVQAIHICHNQEGTVTDECVVREFRGLFRKCYMTEMSD